LPVGLEGTYGEIRIGRGGIGGFGGRGGSVCHGWIEAGDEMIVALHVWGFVDQPDAVADGKVMRDLPVVLGEEGVVQLSYWNLVAML